MRRLSWLGFALWSLAFGSMTTAAAEESTLRLSGSSFISFQDEQGLFLPGGSEVVMHFGEPSESGTVPFRIASDGVRIPEISMPDGSKLTYRLEGPTTGTLRRGEEGLVLEFPARVRVTRRHGERSSSAVYAVRFTTEHAAASNRAGTKSVAVDGHRVVEGSGSVVLVGATTNHSRAEPKPGAAVYAVLAGTFDRLPELPRR